MDSFGDNTVNSWIRPSLPTDEDQTPMDLSANEGPRFHTDAGARNAATICPPVNLHSPRRALHLPINHRQEEPVLLSSTASPLHLLERYARTNPLHQLTLQSDVYRYRCMAECSDIYYTRIPQQFLNAIRSRNDTLQSSDLDAMSGPVLSTRQREPMDEVHDDSASTSGVSSGEPAPYRTKPLPTVPAYYYDLIRAKREPLQSVAMQEDERRFGPRTLECDLCDVRYYSQTSLNEHFQDHYSRNDKKCYICEKEFTSVSSWRLHLYYHKRRKKFQCRVCGKKFMLNVNLESHFRIHTGEKQFQCGVCRRRFPQISSLKRHLRTHLGTKPFQCGVCRNQYSNSIHLRVHLRRHTEKD